MTTIELEEAVREFEKYHTIESIARAIWDALINEEVQDAKIRLLIEELSARL